MAIRSYSTARGASHLKANGVVEAANTGAAAVATLNTLSNTTLQGLEAAVTSAVAAAQLIGTGDASAEIDAIDVAWAAALTGINDVQTQVTAVVAATAQPASVQVLVDLGAGLTRQDVTRALDNIKKYIINDDFPPA